ncbi:MAG: adenosylcobinamide-GDP ribazoletransferase [Clostridia bacterium]|nr:adenosylcobinamide-GDP ribazoletransferase [Clostridia bacterium]
MSRIFKAFFMGLGMFTALPCPYRPWDEDARELMLVCLPIVGAVVGLLWALLGALGLRLLPGISPALLAALPWLLTGFIHLDGFMDTCDALLSWRPLEQRLRILKDSRTGAFAVVGLGLLMLFSYDAASHIDFTVIDRLRALAFIPIVSRCGSAFCVLTLQPIGHSEYAQLEGKSAQRLAVAAMWLIVLVICAIWFRGILAVLLVETLAYAAAMTWACGTLKGVSGDLAGFALTIAECAALVTLANR